MSLYFTFIHDDQQPPAPRRTAVHNPPQELATNGCRPSRGDRGLQSAVGRPLPVSLRAAACSSAAAAAATAATAATADCQSRWFVGVQEAVNMSPQELEAWLCSDESRRAVQQGEEDADKDGRHAARR